MRLLTAAIATLSLMVSSIAQAQDAKMQENLRMVAPALEKYRRGTLLGESGSARACRRGIGAS